MNLGLFTVGLFIGGAIAIVSIVVGLGFSALAERRYRKDPRP